MELTEGQMRVVERLFAAGFRPIAIPPYENALIMRKGECVALLGPVEGGGLKLLAPVTFLVDGNLREEVHHRGHGEHRDSEGRVRGARPIKCPSFFVGPRDYEWPTRSRKTKTGRASPAPTKTRETQERNFCDVRS